MNFITVNGITLHIQQDGNPDGLPLVFINSLGTDFRIWNDVITAFTGDYNIVRYDKRGHGLSDAPTPPYTIRNHSTDLGGLLDALQLDKVVLVGISVGGVIALDYTAQNPERVKALVLCDTFPKIGTTEMWNSRIQTVLEHGIAHIGEAILMRWFPPSFKAQNPAAYDGYFNMLTRTPVAGYTGTCMALRDADLTEAARGIQQPTLVLCGAEDGSTPPELVRGLTAILPNARYHEIVGAGHLPCIEQPQVVAKLIEDFLKEVI
jgi:3-oxoadipate enol-lactonase